MVIITIWLLIHELEIRMHRKTLDEALEVIGEITDTPKEG
jgi:hypothetical protein